MRFLSLRAIFLLGFVVAMPVLALPPVARRIDELLYGPPPADFGRPPAAAPLSEELLQPQAATGTPPTGHGHDARVPHRQSTHSTGPSRFDEQSPAATAFAGNRPEAVAAPELSPTPQFGLPTTAVTSNADRPVDERTLGRLQQLRASLEQLGADYVIVEAQESGRYRFHCRMLVDANSRFTKPFESSSFDPIAAGEQVLRDVQTWRASANEPRTAAR